MNSKSDENEIELFFLEFCGLSIMKVLGVLCVRLLRVFRELCGFIK